MKSAKIVGLGKYLPTRIIDNAYLEKIVDTSDEWITTRTGIKKRHVANKGESASILGYEAAKIAIKRAGLSPKDIDFIILATITPDTPIPSTACYLQNMLGIKGVPALDINAACSGLIYALTLGWQLIKGELYRRILIVATEVLSSVTDWTDRSTCVLFGDGAFSCVLAPTTKGGILNTYLGSDGSKKDILIIPAGGSSLPASEETVKNKLHFIKMKGNELFKIAVNSMVEAAHRVMKLAGLSIKDIDWFIPHQANIRIIKLVGEKLKLPLEKIYINIEKYGNTSAASCGLALCELWEDDKINTGQKIMLDAFGAGLTWGSCIIEWV